jgi:hypothetical protein
MFRTTWQTILSSLPVYKTLKTSSLQLTRGVLHFASSSCVEGRSPKEGRVTRTTSADVDVDLRHPLYSTSAAKERRHDGGWSRLIIDRRHTWIWNRYELGRTLIASAASRILATAVAAIPLWFVATVFVRRRDRGRSTTWNPLTHRRRGQTCLYPSRCRRESTRQATSRDERRARHRACQLASGYQYI